MRKSNFLTVILALFLVGFNVQINAQKATAGSKPIPLSGTACEDSALKPIAGKSYNYKATVSPTGGNFKWWATTDVNFITTNASGVTTDNSSTAALTIADGDFTTATNYNTTATTDNTDLTWTTDRLKTAKTTPTFVVVKYDAPTGSCADNLKVYKIEPINAFTVDVLGLKEDESVPTITGTTNPDYVGVQEQCVSKVIGAKYNTSTNKMEYDYGTNKLYFEVVAANFSKEYTPTFQLEGLQTGQTADIKWGYAKGTYDKTLETGITGATFSKTSTDKVETDATNTNNGVSIYVEVTIKNGTYETTADQEIKLAVTGKNSADESDIKNDDCGTDANFADNTSTQKIKLRPTVTSSTPTTGGTTGTFVQP